MPSYDDLCEYPQIYVSAAAVTILHGDPWQNNSQQLKRLVSDIITAIEEELTTGRYSAAQATKEWFQTQRATLILVGATVALAARALSLPGQSRRPLVELTVQAIERFVQVMTLNYPGDAIAIREWYRTNSQLVYVVGVSVTRALMVAGALDAPPANGEETSRDDVSNEAELVDGDEPDDQEGENAGDADGEREDDEESDDGEDSDIDSEADDEADDEESDDGEGSESEEDTDEEEQDDAGEADIEDDDDEGSDDDSSELLGQDESGEEEDLAEDDPEKDSDEDLDEDDDE